MRARSLTRPQLARLSRAVPPEAVGMALRLGYTLLVFLIGLLLARGLGPEAFGAYAFVAAWILLVAGLIEAGMPPLLVFEVAAYREDGETGLARGMIGLALRVVLALSGLAIAGFVLAERAGWLGGVDRQVLFLGLPLLALLTLSSIAQASTRGLGHVLVGQGSEMAVRPGVQLLLLGLLWLGLGPWPLSPASAMAAYSLSALAALAFALLQLRRAARPLAGAEPRQDRAAWFAGLWKFSMVGWITVLNLQVSLIVLGFVVGESEVAQFRVAWQNAALIPIGLSVMNVIQSPALSAAFRRGAIGEMQRLAVRNCLVSLGFALPVVLFLVAFGEPFITRVFGSGYADSVPPLIALAIGQLITATVGPVTLLLFAARRQRTVLVVQAAMLAVNVAGCLALAPWLGALGAALATAGAMAGGHLVMLLLVRRVLGIWSLPRPGPLLRRLK